MAELEGEDHKVTEAEREFWKSLCVVVQHLSDRALKAEAEVRRLRKELRVREDQVEYLSIKTNGYESAPTLSRNPAPDAAPPLSPSGITGSYTITR